MSAHLRSVVAEAARRFGDRPAIVAGDEVVSYRELDRASDEVAAGLAARGLRPGAVVALTMPSSPEYVVAYLGAAKAGLATAGINPRVTDHERRELLGLVVPDVVVGEGEVAALRRAGATPPAPTPDRDRPVAIVLTSGTTGRPKGACFTDRQLEAIGRIDAGDRWGGGGPLLASTELVHVGFMTKLPWYLRLGSTIHLLRRWRAADALRVIVDARIPTIGAVSAQVALLLREPLESHDLSHVEALVVGGGPSPPAVVEEATRRFGATYSVRYSLTESGGVGTADGVPRSGVEVDVRDGEIRLRSPAVMAGYWRDPDATAAVLVHGWLHTGDHGHLDDDGRLHVTGRAGEMYIRGGYNVFPQEVEAVLADHPDVAEVAVVPRPDDVMGEVGVAVVVPRDPALVPTLDGLRTFAGARLAHHKLPEALVVVPALPRTPMGKLDRTALEARAVADAGAPRA